MTCSSFGLRIDRRLPLYTFWISMDSCGLLGNFGLAALKGQGLLQESSYNWKLAD